MKNRPRMSNPWGFFMVCRMQIFSDLPSAKNELHASILAIGNFDGVHKGHQAIIDECMKHEGTKALLTFSPHPVTILRNQPVLRLTDDHQKAALLKKLGIEVLVIQNVDRKFFTITKKEFAEEMLAAILRIKRIVVGTDFRFGKDGLGDVNYLEQLSKKNLFDLSVVKPIFIDDQKISSSIIRETLQQGFVAQAALLLGRPYAYAGHVMRGDGRGSKIGIPTANIKPEEDFFLKPGVYATIARLISNDKMHFFKAVTNVGYAPTVSTKKQLRIETHLLNESIDLYEKKIEIFFVERIRDEQKFPSLEDLITQLQIDCRYAARLLQEYQVPPLCQY